MNQDFRDMLSAFSAEKVDFMVVGAYALAFHGLPRATGDLDIWIRRSDENARRAWDALARFGAPLSGVTLGDLKTPGNVIQLGVAPQRIDILTSIDGVEFDEAEPARHVVEIDGLTVPVIGRAQLIQNKRAAGRPQDQADVMWLETQDG